ncbi:MAG: carboxypeptidase-like regulatory domain-containing protein [Acidobacteriota bacterium]
MRNPAALLMGVAALALAQTQPVYEISGKVVEPGFGGVPDVFVGIVDYGSSPGEVRQFTTTTDSQGAFLVKVGKPGRFNVMIQKPGYQVSSLLQFEPVLLDSSRTTANITFQATRVGQVSGRVIGDESREPLADFEVYLIGREGPKAFLNLNVQEAKTDAAGRFIFHNVPPGDYITTTRPIESQRQWALEVFKPEEAKETESGFEQTYWPGGLGAEFASPVRLTSGGFAEIGTMIARKATLYRALLHLRGDCVNDAPVEIRIYRRGGAGVGGTYPVPCGTDLLLLGLDPGSYTLHVYPEPAGPATKARPLESQASAIVSFEIRDKNLDLEIALRRHLVMEGQWILPEGMTAKLPDSLTLGTSMEIVPGTWVSAATMERGKDNRFRMAIPAETQIIAMRSQPGLPYAKEIRYNGAPVRDAILTVNPGAATHRLEVFLDANPGFITGTVTNGSRAISDAVIYLAPETYHGEYPLSIGQGRIKSADTAGTFDLPDIVPGDYRILAASPEQRNKLNDTVALNTYLRSAQKITVPPGGSQVLTLRLTDVR